MLELVSKLRSELADARTNDRDVAERIKHSEDARRASDLRAEELLNQTAKAVGIARELTDKISGLKRRIQELEPQEQLLEQAKNELRTNNKLLNEAMVENNRLRAFSNHLTEMNSALQTGIDFYEDEFNSVSAFNTRLSEAMKTHNQQSDRFNICLDKAVLETQVIQNEIHKCRALYTDSQSSTDITDNKLKAMKLRLDTIKTQLEHRNVRESPHSTASSLLTVDQLRMEEAQHLRQALSGRLGFLSLSFPLLNLI